MTSNYLKLFFLISFILVKFIISDRCFADVVEVSIIKSTFIPHVVKVKKGDTVHWINHDGLLHTITSGKAPIHDGKFQGNYVIEEYRKTFNETGWFDYFCTLHNATMRGLIIVMKSSKKTNSP